MPVMSGFEVLERLNDIAPRFGRVPFVFLAAMSDHENELRGRRLGADYYFVKPVNFDVLNAIINERLAGAAGNRAPSRCCPNPSGGTQTRVVRIRSA
jgi:DNA-binding response OmpR family regulator